MEQYKLDFINKIKQGAIDCFKKFGVLASLTLAQACLESDWGRSGLAKKSLNLFGIKWSKDCGFPSDEYDTKEFINNKWITVKAGFRRYKSYDESILDHAKLLINARYKPVIASKDYKEACKQIRDCGYATDPSYTQLLISIIEQYKLNQYDVVPVSIITKIITKILPTPTPQKTTITKVVTANGLNIRSSASSIDDKNVVGKFNINDAVEVISVDSSNWAKITYNSKDAFVSNKYLK